jgi:hypothetical protein
VSAISVVALVTGVVVTLAAVTAHVLRDRIAERWYPDSGIQDWACEAQTLSWPDRLTIVQANLRGVDAPASLTAAAARRARANAAVFATNLEPGSPMRRLSVLQFVVGIWLVLLAIAGYRDGATYSLWVFVFTNAGVCLVVNALAAPWQQRRLLKRFNQSAELNEELADRLKANRA